MDAIERDLRHDLVIRNKKVSRYKKMAQKVSKKPLTLIVENLITHVNGIRKYTTPRQNFYLDEYMSCFEKYGTLTPRQVEVLKNIITECERRKSYNQTT